MAKNRYVGKPKLRLNRIETTGRYATVRFDTLLLLAFQLTFESRLPLLCRHIVGNATGSEVSRQRKVLFNLWPPPPPLSLSVLPDSRKRTTYAKQENPTSIPKSKRKFAKCGHKVQVIRAPTASMQWMTQKKKKKSRAFSCNVKLCFVNFERPHTRSRLGQIHAEWCNFCSLRVTFSIKLGHKNETVTACGFVWLLWAHVNCTSSMSLDNVYLLVDDSTVASAKHKCLEDSRTNKRSRRFRLLQNFMKSAKIASPRAVFFSQISPHLRPDKIHPATAEFSVIGSGFKAIMLVKCACACFPECA